MVYSFPRKGLRSSIVESSKEVNRKYSSNEIYLNSFLTGTTRLEDKNTPAIWVKVTVTKPVWFKGKENIV
jgi:hypothetical protein